MKHDFTKTMRNVFINDEGRQPRSKARENWSVEVKVQPEDKLRFQTFMRQELAYYNNLLEVFNPRVRTFPESISSLTEQWRSIFAQVAMAGVHLTPLLNAKEDAALPENLEVYRKYILGYDHLGERFLTERIASIMDAAASRGNIHSMVRRNMAIEILNYYREQADLFNENTNGSRTDDVFKRNPHSLEELDIQKKRHLQIPRNICRVVYDDVSDKSAILHPYSKNPLVVANHNLSEDKSWNLLVLHQEPGQIPNANTPWILDVKTVSHLYLIKYLDVSNPGRNSAFREGKKRAF
jgi:hypothetical protein